MPATSGSYYASDSSYVAHVQQRVSPIDEPPRRCCGSERRVRRSIVRLHAVVRSTGALLAVLAVGTCAVLSSALGQQL